MRNIYGRRRIQTLELTSTNPLTRLAPDLPPSSLLPSHTANSPNLISRKVMTSYGRMDSGDKVMSWLKIISSISSARKSQGRLWQLYLLCSTSRGTTHLRFVSWVYLHIRTLDFLFHLLRSTKVVLSIPNMGSAWPDWEVLFGSGPNSM